MPDIDSLTQRVTSCSNGLFAYSAASNLLKGLLLCIAMISCLTNQADPELIKYLDEIKFDTKAHQQKMKSVLTQGLCPELRKDILVVRTIEEYEYISRKKDFYILILDMPNTNVVCQLLNWFVEDKIEKSEIILVDYQAAASWRAKAGLQSERLPKLFAFHQQTIIPYENLFVKSDVLSFAKQIKSVKSLDQLTLDSSAGIEKFLNGPEEIKTVLFFYELDEDNQDVQEMIRVYILSTMSSTFQKTRLITKKKFGDEISTIVSKVTKKPVPMPEDYSILSISCDSPVYTSLQYLSTKLKQVTLPQLIKFAANLPTLELDKLLAGIAGNKTSPDDIHGTKVFAIANNILDYGSINQKINQIERELYCDFRGQVRFVWSDAFFNPARLSLLGHTPSLNFPLGAFVDFSDTRPRPMPESLKLTPSTVKEFITDALKMDDHRFHRKYYLVEDKLLTLRELIKEFKGISDIDDPEVKAVALAQPNKITINLSSELSANQVRRLIKHLAHAKRRLELLGGRALNTFAFCVSIDNRDKQTIELVKDHKKGSVYPVTKETYGAALLMKIISKEFGFSFVDELSHLPEEKLDQFISQEGGYETKEAYLYDDL